MPAPPVHATIEHRIAGRVRLRIPERRGDASFFARAAGLMATWPGIQGVQANPLTGSLLVRYNGDSADWLRRAQAEGLFEAVEPVREMTVLKQGAPARPPLSPLHVAATGLAAAGVLQVARGQVIGSASENLWNAYGLWVVTRRPWASALLCGFGLLQLFRGEVLGSATSLFLYAFSAQRLARHLAAEDTI